MTGVHGGKHDPHEKASRDEAVRFQMNLHFLVAVRRFDELLTAHKQAALIWPAVGDIAPDDDVLQAFLDETEAGRGAQAVLAALRAAPCAADVAARRAVLRLGPQLGRAVPLLGRDPRERRAPISEAITAHRLRTAWPTEM